MAERTVLIQFCSIAAALALVCVGCDEKSNAGAPAARVVEVGVVEVTAGSVTISSELAGRTSALLSSEVRPQVNGIITSREFEEGSEVKAGQALYRIDAARYRAARAEAAAALESAKASVAALDAKAERYRSLGDSEAVSRQEVDDAIASARQARAAVSQARAALQTASINLGYTTIKAPISGRIGRSEVTPGALVTANQPLPLATIQQLDPIHVDITQSSAELLDFRRALAAGDALPASATIELVLENGAKYPVTGELAFAEAFVDASTGSITLRAVFPNPDRVLLPGMFVRAIAPQAVLPSGILVPQQGIKRNPKGGATAFVVGAENKVELRSVVTSRAIGDQWLIESGLAAGDTLIVEGIDKVRPGSVVKPVTVNLGKDPGKDPGENAERAKPAASE